MILTGERKKPVAWDEVRITCYKCKAEYVLPGALYTAAKASPAISFYCPYGHNAHFPEGETDEQKLRRENNRLVQRLAEKDDQIKYQRDQREKVERRLVAHRGVTTRIKRRIGVGLCPCCNRSFANLAAHMNTKHKDYPTKESVDEEIASAAN